VITALGACVGGPSRSARTATPTSTTATGRTPATTVAAAPPTTAVATIRVEQPIGAVPLAGCPPPVRHLPPGPPPWHPDVLVPDAALPAPLPPPASARRASDRAIAGKGMWIWKIKQTESGDIPAIVRKAAEMGLSQLWVRVGDSRDGFYAKSVLDQLVPLAHRAHLSVVGWGFPHLYDPSVDAEWTAEVLAWRSPDGQRLDAFSPDLETSAEGVVLSAVRAQVYLGLVRQSADVRPIIATVFPPTDHWMAVYPYADIAPYVDAFAPMVYWGCREPGAAAVQAITRLSPLAPVHVIGQAYNMASEGGREVTPAPGEILRFLDAANRAGATGASLWDWQEASPDQWTALASYPWPRRPGAAGAPA
jgi:hypothetical protein